MNPYILERLRCAAKYTMALAAIEEGIQHPGLRGRFRELLIDNILSPWLPPDVACGTGTILSDDIVARNHTQDDIIIYDRQVVPSVLASNSAPEGVFLLNGVLARVEVKSKLKVAGVNQFVESSKEVCNLKYSTRPEYSKRIKDKPKDRPKDAPPTPPFEPTSPFNLLFAFKTDLETDGDSELRRLCDSMEKNGVPPLSGMVSGICVPGKGFWIIGKGSSGPEWKRHPSKSPEDHLAWFIGFLSNSCYDERLKRHGLDPDNTLVGGIGMYLNYPFEPVA